MTEIVNLGDIIVNYFNQEKTLQETAADLGAIILRLIGRRNTTASIPSVWLN
jgi:hypothetical protein